MTDDRSTGIGSSDVAAIVGLNPYATAFSVYAEKMGLAVKPETEAMRWGKRLQRAIADEWAERNKVEIRWLDKTIRHPQKKHFMATPDAAVVAPNPHPEGLEIKMANWRQRDAWGEENSDQVPPHYLIQAQWQCFVLGWRRCYLAPLFGGNELGSYVVEYDATLGEELGRRCEKFWQEHIVAQKPPEMDWTESSAAALRHLFPQAVDSLYRDSVPEEDALVLELAKLKRQKVAVGRSYDGIVNQVKERIGLAKGLRGPGYVVSWYNTKATSYMVKREAGRSFRARGEVFEAIEEQED
jgi:putative phage-type endonuclease